MLHFYCYCPAEVFEFHNSWPTSCVLLLEEKCWPVARAVKCINKWWVSEAETGSNKGRGGFLLPPAVSNYSQAWKRKEGRSLVSLNLWHRKEKSLQTYTHTMYTHWFTLRLCPDSRGLSWKEFSFPRRQENQKKKGNYCERSERSCLALAVRFLLANLYVCRGNYSKPLGSDYTYFPLSTIVKNNNSQSCVLQEKQMNIVEMDMFEVECFHN